MTQKKQSRRPILFTNEKFKNILFKNMFQDAMTLKTFTIFVRVDFKRELIFKLSFRYNLK